MKIVKIIGMITLGSALSWASPFSIKSGKVDYSITRSGTINNMVKISETGTAKLIFDHYGSKRLDERETIETKIVKIGNQKSTQQTHRMSLIEGAVLKHVNFDAKNIRKIINNDKDFTDTSYEEMLKKFGAKNIGTDSILNLKCDIWQFGSNKQCVYKGVVLRTESDEGDMKTVEIATKAEFDISIKESDFTLPNYPIEKKKD